MRAALSGEEKFKLSSTKTLKKLTWRTRRHVYPTGVIVDKNKSDLIYILRGKISFPSTFDKDAKSLVKHLLVADLSKRYGNLKDGNF